MYLAVEIFVEAFRQHLWNYNLEIILVLIEIKLNIYLK